MVTSFAFRRIYPFVHDRCTLVNFFTHTISSISFRSQFMLALPMSLISSTTYCKDNIVGRQHYELAT